LGDSGVGKSSILLRFTENRFLDELIKPPEFVFTILPIHGANVKLQIFDSCPKPKDLTETHSLPNFDGIIIVYDITNIETFNNVLNWIKQIDHYVSETIPKVLVGNKSDMITERNVTKEEGIQLATQHKLIFLETSAKAASNVIDAFRLMVHEIFSAREEY